MGGQNPSNLRRVQLQKAAETWQFEAVWTAACNAAVNATACRPRATAYIYIYIYTDIIISSLTKTKEKLGSAPIINNLSDQCHFNFLAFLGRSQ